MTVAARAPIRHNQARTEWTRVTFSSGRSHRGAEASPPWGPVPVVMVPAIRRRKPITTRATLVTCSIGVTLTSGLPSGSWRRTYRAMVTKTIIIDSKKCVATEAGCRSVHTVIPPTTPWPSTPPGMIAAIRVRSRLRGTERRTARSVMTPTANTRKVSVRLPNSTAALKGVCAALVGTKRAGVHLGHSEQPNPEEVTRTTAPVTAIPALTTMLPNAQARRDRGDGVQMVRARRSRTITPAAARAICQPQKGTPRTTTSSRSAATGGRVLGAVAAAGETDIRQTVVHGSGVYDATPPLSSPARTCSPHTEERHFGEGRGQGVHLDRCGLFLPVATQPIGLGQQDGSANFSCVGDASFPRRVRSFEGVLRRPCGRRY